MRLPMAATVAGPEPLMAAKNMEAMMVTRARPPVKEPTRAEATRIRRREMPPFSMSAPATMKKGTAIRGKESPTAVNIFCGAIIRFMLGWAARAMRDDRPMLTATGVRIKTNRMKLPKRMKLIDIVRPPQLRFPKGC